MKTILRIAVAALIAGVGIAPVRAQSLAEVQARMRERLPAVAVLKERKAVGETNLGYLGILDENALDKKAHELVAAENADRKVVYAAIAAKTGATEELVGKKRAKQIAGEAKSGMMLQNEKGEWYEKK